MANTSRKILGISAFYHDSAAAIIEDGKIMQQLRKNGLPETSIPLTFL
ncbi:hypothetical protein [Algoriphagus boritolerans]